MPKQHRIAIMQMDDLNAQFRMIIMTKQNLHRKHRRKFDPGKKTHVVLEGLSKVVSVTELCRREKISPERYYCWRKAFIEAGGKAFTRKRTSENKRSIPHARRVIRKITSDYMPIINGLASTSDLAKLHSRRTPEQILKILQIVDASVLTVSETLELIGITRSSYYEWRKKFNLGGPENLRPKNTVRTRKSDDENVRTAIFEILHSPPKCYDVNRTSWRMKDLRQVLLDMKGIDASYHVIRDIIRHAGYRWKKAKVVLTSNDPEYREKLARIQSILSNLDEDELFCSIDEFGPFAVKMQGGRRLVGPNEYPAVPQFQKSKGSLILTAALELSRNQVTHFYSKKKDTEEMIRLLKKLLKEYKGCSKLYLSWDAASWHASRKLYDKVGEVNVDEYRATHNTPFVELAPLPASAQFLNVIESVFSGMARAVIHNSNYDSVNDAKRAIDRHFRERNRFFKKHPKKAGKKIWGEELVPGRFSESHNCKDPKWR